MTVTRERLCGAQAGRIIVADTTLIGLVGGRPWAIVGRQAKAPLFVPTVRSGRSIEQRKRQHLRRRVRGHAR